jgi:hypothetical protein
VGIDEDSIVPGLSAYRDVFVVSWDAPADDGGAPIAAYDVTVTDGTDTWTCSTTGALTCAVTGLPSAVVVSPPYDIEVTATNVIGVSDPGPLTNVLLPAPPAGETYVPPDPPEPAPYTPDAVIDVTTTGANDVEFFVPGYVSVPQGVVRVSVTDPARASVRIQGGVLAAWIDLTDPRPNGLKLGHLNPTTQRIVRIVTRTTDGSSVVSDAVVQINENEGWAVNSWEVQPGP